MRDRGVYLGGAISGCNWNEVSEWRDDMANLIYTASNGRWTCFNPCEHIPDEFITHESIHMEDKEAMDYDLFHLLRSDLMIINFAYNPKSIGTIAEMGAAYTHHIPILGLNETKEELHPWQLAMPQKIFSEYQNLVNYLVNHYLNEK